MSFFKKISALTFALLLGLSLVACNSSAASSASSAASSASASASAQAGQIVGSPWATSVLSGNLPSEQPALKDDMYTHFNYEYLSAHQDQNTSSSAEHADEPKTALLNVIKDSSTTNHNLDQLRLFFDQASDSKTLQSIGLSEVLPYIDRIGAVNTLEEMNALLAANDFPFSPFIIAGVTTNDTRATNIVGISPNFVLFDAQVVGGMYYQESDDPQVQQALQAEVQNAVSIPMLDFMAAGMEQEKAQEAGKLIKAFEQEHGKHVESTSHYLKSDYGAMAQAARNSYHTLDETAALMPNFPIREVLEKLGKAHSSTYVVSPEWAESFNNLWTEENLRSIKVIAQAKILGETRPFRDPSSLNALMETVGQPAKDTDTFAYTACNNTDTFAQVLASTYSADVLGPEATQRLTALSQELVSEYKTLIGETGWLGEQSRQRITEKLDNMTLNVLQPAGGYFDYSTLELTSTDKGGTLFSNYLALKKFRQDRESEMIGAPASAASSWFNISPMTPNAFYDPTTNSINILPGYMTSLVYGNDMDDSELMARSGFIIGHEISHAFDYVNSQVDAYGQPNLVFDDSDVDSFVLKSSTLASYYASIEIEPGLNVDGQNVAGEATADLCGMQANLAIAAKNESFDYEKYFNSLASLWAEVESESVLKQKTLDNHPLGNLRVNVNAQMFDTIYDVMGVAEGDGMFLAPNERIVIWGPKA